MCVSMFVQMLFRMCGILWLKRVNILVYLNIQAGYYLKMCLFIQFKCSY